MVWNGSMQKLSMVAFATGALLLASNVLSQDQRPIPEQERELVRKVYEGRDNYQSSLERLRAYYIHVNDEENRYWVEKELTDFHLIVKSPYILDMDLPSAELRPDTNIPKANRIFREAVDWLNRRTVTDRAENYKRAELLLRRLIRDYPRSDKLDEACFYLGEIYSSKYFGQYRRAVAFYERVFLYEPNTNLDARMRAAYIYERNLSDNRKAVDLYQEVLRREIEPNQTKDARRRLDALLNTRTPNRL